MKKKFRTHPIVKEMGAAQCLQCRHYHPLELRESCDAFPMGIPTEILVGNHDHDEAFAGDNGVLFEPATAEEMTERLNQIETDLALRQKQRLAEELAIAK